ELEPHRLGHPETVDVEDPAAHAELRDVLDHRHALEADRFEVRGELLRAANISLSQLEASGGESARQLGALQQRARGRHHDAEIAAANSLEGLHSFPRDLGVGFRLTEALPGRIEGDLVLFNERRQVGEPTLGAGDIVADDYENPGWEISGERREKNGVGRSVKAANARPGARPGKLLAEMGEFP